jgi:hypothetical protein
VNVPDTLQDVFLIEKDTKRFPDTKGWAYAVFDYQSRVRHVHARSDRNRQLRVRVPYDSGGQKITFSTRTRSGNMSLAFLTPATGPKCSANTGRSGVA